LFLSNINVDLLMVLLSVASGCSRAGRACRVASPPRAIAPACPFSRKSPWAQVASFPFSSPQEPLTASFNIFISALLLQQSVSLPGEREYKHLAQVGIYFSVFMDAESIVPVQNVSGEA